MTDGLSPKVRRAVAAHDARVREVGLELWLGAEPTFTDPTSSAPEWIGAAVGGDKEERALALWVALHEKTAPVVRPPRANEPPPIPGRRQLALRTLGRQYPDEDAPRFSLGLYAFRDGSPLCPSTFEDPAFTPVLSEPRPAALADALAAELGATRFEVEGALPHRMVTGTDPRDARCQRLPLEGRAIPESGLVDELAREGFTLVCLGEETTPRGPCVVLELPELDDVDAFVAFLGALANACQTTETRTLILRGHPPPVDARVRFATLTPDPGVVEVNMAPCTELSELAAQMHAIHEAAEEVGLAAQRRHFNGELSDSGGGGHLTFGASSPEGSPFFRFPLLLPKLIAYLNRHPSLSYYFGSHAAGSAGQSPRADESARELFGELQLALHRLVRDVETLESTDEVATRLWSSLAPFLADRFGNSHRSEINVEKLWNPWLPGRGKLGVIELRAFRQAPTSAHAVARAALFRAILARLAVHDFPIALRDLGADLHDRYALPFFLESDLREVLGDLERAGFGLPPALAHELFADPHRVYGEVELGDPNAPITLTVRRALEHWPLVGDLSQQAGTSRLVDPSTTRVEVRVTGPSERVGRVSVGVRDGEKVFRAPTTYVDDGQRSSVVVGVRFRAFVPNLGLHPSLPARDPIELVVSVGERHYALALHAWIPGGGVYPGLPEDDAEAAKRRLDRFVLRTRPVAKYVAPPAGAAGRHTLDARWL
ncbi:MAG: transglutaminase family protein [Sandaracinus sp.]|nr:transglutaminase family protein [Sandaracinus sp.]MCB9617286.1 transglutaminase family protein [Sandaracinus sp.]